MMERSLNLNFNNSYIYFTDKYQRSWRSKIKSTLEFNNKKIYATEKCLSEHIGLKPFFSDNNYEFYPFVETNNNEKKILFLKNYTTLNLLDSKGILKRNYVIRPDIVVNIVCNEHKRIKIGLDDLVSQLNLNSDEIITCKIKYKYKGTWYTHCTRCDYINFGKNHETNRIYVQPISAELPFYDKGRFKLAYFTAYIGDNNSSKLQIAVRENSGLILGKRTNVFSQIIQAVTNLLKPLISQSTYSRIINIDDYEITFFK